MNNSRSQRSISERNPTYRLREAAALGLTPDALRKQGTFLSDVRCRGTLHRCKLFMG
jgi:hypothetical protein